jgi:hypothetical protein
MGILVGITGSGHSRRRGIMLLAQGDRDLERIESLRKCMCANFAGLPITGFGRTDGMAGWMDGLNGL